MNPQGSKRGEGREAREVGGGGGKGWVGKGRGHLEGRVDVHEDVTQSGQEGARTVLCKDGVDIVADENVHVEKLQRVLLRVRKGAGPGGQPWPQTLARRDEAQRLICCSCSRLQLKNRVTGDGPACGCALAN